MLSANPVVIIGSYNAGLSMKGKRFPQPGETFAADHFFEGPGGKGANQAVAAACFGAKTAFIGCVGADRYGQDALAMFKKYGIDTNAIRIDAIAHTGMAFIMIDESGQNMIEIVSGANQCITINDIDDATETIADARIVGFQLEGSIDIVDYSLCKARSLGVKTLLDPAPATKLDESLYPLIDYIKPNETEATILTGIAVRDADSARKAGQWFLDRGVRQAIVTLGKEGAVLVSEKGWRFFSAPKVKALDSTGAGDVFSGAMMSALAQDKDVDEAIIFASHAAALSTTRLGVVESIPELREVNEFRNNSSCRARRLHVV
jgi:ribokinase